MRTKEELQKAIDLNLEMRKNIPSHSSFGDENWKKIDEEVSILKDAIAFGSVGSSDDYCEKFRYDNQDERESDFYHEIAWIEGEEDQYMEYLEECGWLDKDRKK